MYWSALCVNLSLFWHVRSFELPYFCAAVHWSGPGGHLLLGVELDKREFSCLSSKSAPLLTRAMVKKPHSRCIWAWFHLDPDPELPAQLSAAPCSSFTIFAWAAGPWYSPTCLKVGGMNLISVVCCPKRGHHMSGDTFGTVSIPVPCVQLFNSIA